MNVKSMIVGLVIAVVASTGTYFLLPPPRGAEASNCSTYEIKHEVELALDRFASDKMLKTLQYVIGDHFNDHVKKETIWHRSLHDAITDVRFGQLELLKERR
jgi:hypothetical protein